MPCESHFVGWPVSLSVYQRSPLAPRPGSAQWLNYPTPGILRLPDGRPDQTPPAPRLADGKPDLSGLWGRTEREDLFDLARNLKPTAFLHETEVGMIFRRTPRTADRCLWPIASRHGSGTPWAVSTVTPSSWKRRGCGTEGGWTHGRGDRTVMQHGSPSVFGA